ncbi:unnamed protein product, partial [Amoebophrya sp. A120]
DTDEDQDEECWFAQIYTQLTGAKREREKTGRNDLARDGDPILLREKEGENSAGEKVGNFPKEINTELQKLSEIEGVRLAGVVRKRYPSDDVLKTANLP